MKNNYLTRILLLMLVAFSGLKALAQYAVSPIPHQAYAAGLPVAFSVDDIYSEVIPLTFDFNYFGTTYNQVIVSTNGYINFTTTDAGAISPWAFTQTIPNANFPVKNSFLGCYHDMNNFVSGGGATTYAVTGTAPFRKFVVIYDNIPQFSCGLTAVSSIQMVLYESLNILDSQIVQKQLCAGWNSGSAVIGVINTDGTAAFTPPGRNTGAWEADHEGWRFNPGNFASTYRFIKCDPESDGFETYNLAVAQTDLWAANPGGVTFHATSDDAVGQANPLSINFMNVISGQQTIFANVNGEVKTIALSLVNCDTDYDDDSVATADEDVNSDTNLANDDSDNDGIPDFIDNDDDGDLVLTSQEYVFGRNATALLDTDSDGIPNYLDNDDDGDNVLTINEDYDGNNNPADDDSNNNGIPDYLDNAVALGVAQQPTAATGISLYPNPASGVLYIENKSGKAISEIAIYATSGQLVQKGMAGGAQTAISVSDLQAGIYFVRIQMGKEVQHYKFIKK